MMLKKVPQFNGQWKFAVALPEKISLPEATFYSPEASFLSMLAIGLGSEGSCFEKLDKDIRVEFFPSTEGQFFWRVLNEIASRKLRVDHLSLFNVSCEVFLDLYKEDPPKALAGACCDLLSEDLNFTQQNLEFHTRRLLEHYYRLEMGKALKEKTKDGFAKGDRLQNELNRLMDLDKSKLADLCSSETVMNDLIEEIMDRESNPDKYRNIDWGYPKHKEKIPLAKGHLVIIGGRSGSGKSTYAMNLLRKQLFQNHHVALFSLEMSKIECGRILLSQIAEVSYEGLLQNSKDFNQDQFDRIYQATNQISKFPLTIIEKAALSIEDIQRMSLQIKNKHKKLDAIFIDHIHIMGDGNNKFNTVREKIMHISAGLKNLAKELELPIFALAQMNRNSEARTDKTPITADLKESGSLEQDADTIIFTYRETDPAKENDSYVIVRKNRHGSYCDFKINMEVNPFNKIFEEAQW